MLVFHFKIMFKNDDLQYDGINVTLFWEWITECLGLLYMISDLRFWQLKIFRFHALFHKMMLPCSLKCLQ